MSDWLTGLRELGRRGQAAAMVTVLQARGSTPREVGAKMTVGMDATWDSVGGGQLEHAAIESARLLLEDDGVDYTCSTERHALGPSLGQCCGGVATLLIERIPAGAAWVDVLHDAGRDNVAALIATAVNGASKRVFKHGEEPLDCLAPLLRRAMETGRPVLDKAGDGRWFIEPVRPAKGHVVLFGAGHVGRALAGILAALPGGLSWIDSRVSQFPDPVPAGARAEVLRRPEARVERCPPGAFYLVMTHSHPLDLAICEQILKRGDFAYCGLIGSASKRRHFEKRLRLKGITEPVLNRLTCPIGIDGVTGKRPAEIAVAVAAQVLQVRELLERENRAVAGTVDCANAGSPLPLGEGQGEG